MILFFRGQKVSYSFGLEGGEGGYIKGGGYKAQLIVKGH